MEMTKDSTLNVLMDFANEYAKQLGLDAINYYENRAMFVQFDDLKRYGTFQKLMRKIDHCDYIEVVNSDCELRIGIHRKKGSETAEVVFGPAYDRYEDGTFRLDIRGQLISDGTYQFREMNCVSILGVKWGRAIINAFIEASKR